ncbi:hypothetical protein DZC78_00845 [Olleya aquimaris]|uniref:STAS/SEC14 domain-containing protein n=1 Tax=Olleya sediminilitoris TaxID=2795739 RepID=A0ABS1WPP3_9FLAO|nr:hypothetical protein [Olleya sediminilitoris]AXO78990.1 hypothetical protein DZC78_00845 [Olleya aquimaris]MBL7561085.1 hypothetical protein [Olleya sediminilitoris]
MYTKTKLSFCTLLVSDNVIISEINEGVHMNKKHATQIIKFVLDVFGDRPHVYISNRIHSYSVDTIVYSDVSKVKSLVGFAVVSNTLAARNAEIERLFLNKPFEIFSKLEEATTWANQILKNQIKLK